MLKLRNSANTPVKGLLIVPARTLKVRDVLEHLTIFGLLSAFVLPPMELLGYGVYLVTLISFILLVFFIGLSGGIICRSGGLIAIGLICFFVLLSTLDSYIRLHVPYDFSDALEVVKYLQFIPYILIIQFFDADSFERRAHKYLILASVIFVLVGLLQIFGPESLVSALGKIYGTVMQQQVFLSGKRMLITGSDPNTGGAIALMFVAYNFFAFISYRRMIHFLLGILALYLLLMTQSRTVLVGLVFAVVVYGAFLSKTKFVTRLVTVSLVVILLLLSIRYFDLGYVIAGYKQVESGSNMSLNVRLENIRQAYIWFSHSILLGWGPAKAIHPTIIDSEYALILERYGICGALAFAFYIIHHFRISIKSMRIVAGRWVFGRLSLFYMLFGIIIMTTNNLFSGYQLMAIIIFLLCLVTVRVRQQIWLYNSAKAAILSGDTVSVL